MAHFDTIRENMADWSPKIEMALKKANKGLEERRGGQRQGVRGKGLLVTTTLAGGCSMFTHEGKRGKRGEKARKYAKNLINEGLLARLQKM